MFSQIEVSRKSARSRFNVFLFLFIILFIPGANAVEPQRTLVLLVGAPGNDDYAAKLAESAHRWEKAAAAGHLQTITYGLETNQSTARDFLRDTLQKETAGDGELWLVLLGHGTFDGRDARFNARGDDFTAGDLAEWLKPIRRPTIVIAAFSSSGAFLKPLSAAGRVVITATRAGSEENYSRLGEYLSEAVGDPASDIDQDGQTSLLEAWLAAAQRVAAFYKSDARLATEHSLLDDNGDGFGTPADWFKGVRAVKKSQTKALPDGTRAHQIFLIPSAAEAALSPEARAERDRLEVKLAALRDRKSAMQPDDYYRELEGIMLQLAKLYDTPAKP
jgi:hypothetical protein